MRLKSNFLSEKCFNFSLLSSSLVRAMGRGMYRYPTTLTCPPTAHNYPLRRPAKTPTRPSNSLTPALDPLRKPRDHYTSETLRVTPQDNAPRHTPRHKDTKLPLIFCTLEYHRSNQAASVGSVMATKCTAIAIKQRIRLEFPVKNEL